MATVNATRMELSRTKKRLATAVRGHKLLKDKQDEMARQFMIYVKRGRELRLQVEEKLASVMTQMSYAEAEMGKLGIDEALMLSSENILPERGVKNIMSLEVPDIKLNQVKYDISYGFAFTSEKLDAAVISLGTLMPILYELASVEKVCTLLADEMERTRRRVNALEHVMIPEMKRTIKFITMKLEDNERGNLIRLMKVKEMMET